VAIRVPFLTLQAPGFGIPIASLGKLIGTIPSLPEGSKVWLESLRAIAASSISRSMPEDTQTTIGSFVAHLLARLSYADPSLRSLAVGLRASGALATSQGVLRTWDPESVLSEWAQTFSLTWSFWWAQLGSNQ
jgi:hypothetical protein